MNRLLLITVALIGLSGCVAEVGSDAWCEDMADKPKGDWSANEAADFAQHCIVRTYD